MIPRSCENRKTPDIKVGDGFPVPTPGRRNASPTIYTENKSNVAVGDGFPVPVSPAVYTERGAVSFLLRQLLFLFLQFVDLLCNGAV